MRKACAWCGKHIEGDPNDPETSHGMCPACKERETRKAREALAEGRSIR